MKGYHNQMIRKVINKMLQKDKKAAIEAEKEKEKEINRRLELLESKAGMMEINIQDFSRQIGGILTDLSNQAENLRSNNAVIEQNTMGIQRNSADIEMLTAKTNINAKNIEQVKFIERVSSEHNENKESYETGINTAETRSDSYNPIDYFNFENYFRGSREQTKKAQEQYIPYFYEKTKVVDLGCGRGEFLELLKENRIQAQGVDFYPEFAEYCKGKGLNVELDDAIAFLRRQDKVDGIFAGQLIEHLDIGQIIEICNLAYEKLEAGSYIVLETPNPTSLAIYTNAFYIDPSHVKPVHPLTMQYLMKNAGFRKIEIVYTASSKVPIQIPELECTEIGNSGEFNESMKKVSELLFGSQDYAIIAQR